MKYFILKLLFYISLMNLGAPAFAEGMHIPDPKTYFKSDKLSAFSDFCKAMPESDICQSMFESTVREGASMTKDFLADYGLILLGSSIVIVDAGLGFPLISLFLSAVLPSKFAFLASSSLFNGLVYQGALSLMTSFGMIDPRLAKIAHVANSVYVLSGGQIAAQSGGFFEHIENVRRNWGSHLGFAPVEEPVSNVVSEINLEIFLTPDELEIL